MHSHTRTVMDPLSFLQNPSPFSFMHTDSRLNSKCFYKCRGTKFHRQLLLNVMPTDSRLNSRTSKSQFLRVSPSIPLSFMHTDLQVFFVFLFFVFCFCLCVCFFHKYRGATLSLFKPSCLLKNLIADGPSPIPPSSTVNSF